MNGNETTGKTFLASLARLAGAWKRGLALALLLKVAGWAVVAATLYFAADFFLALGERTRFWLNLALPAGLVAAALPEVISILRLGPAEAARRGDRLGKHRRNEILTAWELLGERGAASPDEDVLSAFLVQRSVDAALERTAALAPGTMRPAVLIARRSRLLAGALLAALAVVLSCGIEAFLVIAPRMIWPGRDIPPYSRYRFHVTPEMPAIVYGGSAEVSVTIRGAPVEDRVWMMTRRSDRKVQRVACFQDGSGRHAQRLEHVTLPVEFCFAVGRARSRWHAVDLQLQPQVVRTQVRLVPPGYTGLPPAEFLAGQEDVAGVRGTRIALTLTSNRPLKEGTLTIRRRQAAAGSEQVIAGRLTSAQTAVFEWTLNEDAEARATLRDVRGTPTAEPLVLPQKLLPDEAPKVSLSEPPDFSMATTSAVLQVSGQAEDDFGIERIDWIRGVVGFNDRAVTLRQGPVGKQSEIAMELNLGKLGAAAGQVLEFYAESLDNNPHLTGVGASGIVRVKVIGEEEYAEMLRNQETLEEFLARYQSAEAAINRVVDSLEALRGAVSNNLDQAAIDAAVSQSLAAHAAAETLYQMLARDFAIFDIELALSQASARIGDSLAENRAELEALRRAPGPDGAAKVDGMIARLKEEAESIEAQAEDASLVAGIAKVMDGAARFQALVQRQADLVRRLKQRYGGIIAAADRPFLSGYGDEERAIAEELAAFAAEAAAAAGALPETLQKLKDDTLTFLDWLAETGAADHLGRAVGASRNSDAPLTYREAQLALEKLESLLKSNESNCDNSFAGLCRGQQPGIGPDGIQKTLQEMFRAICRKRGVGNSTGSGQGIGAGGSGPGFGASGYSELATPVYGPGRSRAGRAGDGRGEAGEGRGAGAGPAGRRPTVVERLRGADALEPSGEAVQLERLPVKYREAVKRYFQNGTEGGGE